MLRDSSPVTVIADFITYCKWLYAYCCINVSRWLTKKRFDVYDIEAKNDPVKTAFLAPEVEIEAESPQPESHLLHVSIK